MQTLGLSSKPQAADNIFKRLFWPSIESGYDVDLLGQQGFWLCLAVAAVSGLSILMSGSPTIAAVYAMTFFLGGCGVRERSIAAAVIVFVLYGSNIFVQTLAGGFGNPLITAVVVMLLFSNIRATVLTRMWSESPADEAERSELPERGTATVKDRLANVLPGKLWPIWRFVFYPMSVVVMTLFLLAVFALERVRSQPVPHTSVTIQNEEP